jgi:hypothetical protein
VIILWRELFENVAALERKIKRKPHQKRNDHDRDGVVNVHVFGDEVNTAGVEDETACGNLGISPGLVLDFRVGGLKAPVAIQNKVRPCTGKGTASDRDDIPDMGEFGETEEHAVVKTGCDERGNLRAAELSEKRSSCGTCLITGWNMRWPIWRISGWSSIARLFERGAAFV